MARRPRDETYTPEAPEPAAMPPSPARRARTRKADAEAVLPAAVSPRALLEAAAAVNGDDVPAGTKIAEALAPLRVPIDRYTPHPDNPRRHPHLEQLRASYRRWGQYRAIVVQAETGHIIVGNGLHRVMGQEGASEIAANVMDLDEAEARALLIADNRLAELGDYDQEALAKLLTEQDALGALGGTGYSIDDLDRLMRGMRGGPEIDAVPALPATEPWVKAGELYQLGTHRLLVGDATDPAAWARLMGDELADMVWTDPPYGVGYYGKTPEHLQLEGDRPDPVALEDLLESALGQAVAHTKPGRGLYCASPGGTESVVFIRVLERLGVYRQTIVWVKDAFVMGRQDYHWRHELVQAGATPGERPRRARHKEGTPIHYGWRPGGAHWFVDDRTLDTVWEFDRPKASREHPTMKPVGLIERSLLASSRRGQLVVDPFVGSGSTIIAAETTRRRCYAMDIDPRYAQVAIERWQTFSGGTAEKLAP